MLNKATTYIDQYNKENYKMYQFRVKRSEEEVIRFLDNLEKRNSYIVSLIEKDKFNSVLKLKDIKEKLKSVMGSYNINEVYLFGSYARGDATADSDVDIYCEKGNIKTFIDQCMLEEELQNALNKKVDIVFIGSEMNDYFKKQMMADLICLCLNK